MSAVANQIKEYIECHKQEMLDKVKEFINLEGQTEEKENMEKVRAWVIREFEAEGFVCSITEVAPDRCGLLTGILGADRPGKPIQFSGHLDTVFPAGTFRGENPFYIEDDKMFGPGVCDMKGGVIIALYVVKALNNVGYNARPITIVFAGEEEFDHEGNDCDKLITEYSRQALCGFNFECANLKNELCVGQKCQITYRVKVHGLGGHAGNEFYKAKNPVHETILKLNDVIKLTDNEKGTTVSATVVEGGHHNSAIPDLCSFIVDIRANGPDEEERVQRQMEEIINKSYVEGITSEFTKFITKMPPFSETEEIKKLFDFVNKVAEENGYKAFGKVVQGGTTDAGNIARAGIPVICACGVRGDFVHNIREYGMVDSLFERAAIFAMTVYEMN